MAARTNLWCYLGVAVMAVMLRAAVSQVAPPGTSSEEGVDPTRYLAAYGYNPDHLGQPQLQEGDINELRENKDKMTEAIRAFQFMANLPPTGVLTPETLAHMNRSRCGVPDFLPKSMTNMRKKRFTKLMSAWSIDQIRSLTYRVGDIPSNLGLNRADVEAEIRTAFKMWRSVIPSKINEVQTSQGKADIELGFYSRDHGDDNPFDGPGRTLAHAFAPNQRNAISGDVHFDADENWRIKPNPQTSAKDVFVVALHELGHSLGLGHTNVPNSIMQPFYNPRQLTLGEDDINGVQNLYGTIRKPPPPPAPPSNTRMPTEATTTTTRSPRPPPTLDPGNIPFQPDYCLGNLRFDAIVQDANDRVFAFFGWSVYELVRGGVARGYPKRTSDVFEGHSYGVDAALYLKRRYPNNEVSKIIYLFKDNFVFTYDANTLRLVDPSRPFQLIGSVFRDLPTHLSAIFTWTRNGRVYAFKGDQYYRLNHDATAVDHNYPQTLRKWRMEFETVDSGFVWPLNGRTYFFSEQRYLRYDDQAISTDRTASMPYPRQTRTWWLGCQEAANGLNSNPHRPKHLESLDRDGEDARRVSGNDTPDGGFGVDTETGGQIGGAGRAGDPRSMLVVVGSFLLVLSHLLRLS